MDDPAIKKKYDSYKIKVKRWEKDFIKRCKRIPSKYDIREAPEEIVHSYKMYFKMKTEILENTLSEVASDDGFDVFENESSQADVDTSSYDFSKIYLPSGISFLSDENDENKKSNLNSPNIVSRKLFSPNISSPKLFSPNFCNRNQTPKRGEPKYFEPVADLDINKKAWVGVSKSKSLNEIQFKQQQPVKNAPPTRVKSSLNTKLFESSKSFSMRNPRKSLSRLSSSNMSSISNLSLDNFGKPKESLPDLETILTQKAKEQKSPQQHSVTSLLKMNSKDISFNVDKAWLDRCCSKEPNGSVGIQHDEVQRSVQPPIPKKIEKFGLSNIKIPSFDNLGSTPKANQVDLTENQSVVQNVTAEQNVIAENIYQYENDSDEVISNSEEEQTEKQTYRHIAKRRRILRDIDRNKINNENNNNINPKEIIKPLGDKLQSSSHMNPDVCVENENKIVNDSMTVVSKRKTITKKRTAKSGKKNNFSEKHSDESCEEESFTESGKKLKRRPKKSVKVKSKDKPAVKPIKATRRKSAKFDPEADIESQPPNEEEYQPINLALEVGQLKSLPSANLEVLKNAEVVLESYIKNGYVPKKTKENAAEDLSVRKSEAQERLEKKIKAGKLNENFVRIDINKKVFVRGKKSVNYSKYKKKQWKNRKEAYALSGPGMDMRGCDGGILSCHKCGQPGHFARQCKQKGDGLIPLDAIQLDESPFLTLEEAAEMAKNRAVQVHSNNLSKLPQAGNCELYKQDEDNIDDVQIKDVTDRELNGSQQNETDTEENDELENIFEMDEEMDSELMKINEEHIEPVATESKETKASYIGHKIPEDFLEKCGVYDKTPKDKEVDPIYDLSADGTAKEMTDEVMEVLRMFGHKSFRKGQDKAVMRILSGLSTLVTLSTGSGKSLCYQLPAYIYSRQKGCITLVISPLVSLMEDQVHDIPSFLRAYCLHTNQTPQQRVKIMELINKGDIDILLVSPEAVVAGERSTGFGALLGNLPPIAFACIDEAHCVSQWSHNFRPSYLMICKVLKQKLGVKTILGLTATATLPTRESIIRHLNIEDGQNGVISDIPLPDNLILSVSKESNRDNALMHILRSERFEECQSIIIYCTRRDECERIAAFIRTCMQDKPAKESTNKRKRINWHAEPYHAGMAASRRRTIQNAFMKNELRIVVATIAFGMGINKPDIRAVIHYNMPKSYESYVQEIGRAGRDGKLAHCHLFLDAKGQDRGELKKHIFGNSIDRHVIRKLLQKIFIPCSCNKNLKSKDFLETHEEEIKASQGLNWNDEFDSIEENRLSQYYDVKPSKRLCPGHEIAFSIQETVQSLDIPEENISTLLCYLELDGRYNLNMLSNAYTKCKVISYGGPAHLKNAAKNCPPLAMAIALQLKNETFDEADNTIEFSVVEIASAIGWNSGVVKHQLKSLEWTTENGLPRRSLISVKYHELGFRIKAPGDFTYEEIDEALDSLYQRSVLQEKTQLLQLQFISEGLGSVSFRSCTLCCNKDFNDEYSHKLKTIIRDYFQHNSSAKGELKQTIDETTDTEIIGDVQSLINMYPDNSFTGRSIARIFYGIGSPNYPPVIWGRCKYWRVHMKVNFNRLVKLANEVIVRRRM